MSAATPYRSMESWSASSCAKHRHRDVTRVPLFGSNGPDDATAVLHCNSCNAWGFHYSDGTVMWRHLDGSGRTIIPLSERIMRWLFG